MNAPQPAALLQSPPLHVLALAALRETRPDAAHGPEAAWLAEAAPSQASCSEGLQRWLAEAPANEQLLHGLARALGLGMAELLAVALCMAVELDPMVGRVLAWLQAPVGSSRPTVGLVLAAAQRLAADDGPAHLLDGAARECGLLQFDNDDTRLRPLPEQALLVPLPLVLALRDGRSRWPGVRTATGSDRPVPSLVQAAQAQARALGAAPGTLAVRSGDPCAARAAAALVARALGREPAFFEQDPAPGAGLWLTLCGLLPVLCLELGPGEARRLRPLPAYRGPVLLATGTEGSFEQEGQAVTAWRVPLPAAPERALLWNAMLEEPALAQRLGTQYRYDAGRIVQLGRAARYHASLESAAVCARHVAEAARSTAPARLGTVAELLPEPIAHDVLVVPPALREGLLALRRRCEAREGLADGLGAATQARYRPGVRALLVGASGTGKTLAAGWLATQLGLPLYRVDLAAVSSKYIGETEKNLAQLFARAEHDEVVLLFDEADALFGKRTEVRESTDRFANAQTNYLLQRIESFEGIALLTSNSRSRFDSAFTRRLDAILDFPQPTPQERRALWVGHLGPNHGIADQELNQLAGTCELAGGHIRNMVLAAAARARANGRSVAYEDLLHAVAAECRKLGRQPPAGMAAGR